MKTYYNSNPIYNQSPSSIDRENGIIRDIVIVKTGEAKGHGVLLDESFVADVEKFGNEKEVGIKARFGHPNICSTALGTYLGRYRNFRNVGDKVLADLYLDKSSAKSPKGNLYDYILDLAESNPDMFGASIAFNAGEAIIRKVNEDGKQTEKKFAVINSLYAIDFVDDPAVTNGLFRTGHPEHVEGEDDFAFQVTSFFDTHPEIFQLIDSKPEILNGFLKKYKTHKEEKFMNIKDEIKNLRTWVTDNFSKISQGGHPEHVEGSTFEGGQGDEETLKSEFEAKITQIESGHAELSRAIEALEQELAGHTELVEVQVQELNTLNEEVNTLFQNITSFYDKFNMDFTAIKPMADSKPLNKLSTINNALIQVGILMQSKDDEIALLQSMVLQNKAMPTLPDITADPLIGFDKKPSDFTGKSILENIPSTARRKLNLKSKV